MKRWITAGFFGSLVLFTACQVEMADLPVTESDSDLKFTELPRVWDEALPLGNATVGALVWQRDSVLRLSLDRVDLWDLRPTDSLSGPNYSFKWVQEKVRERDYLPVQQKFDHPYDALPAPSKIPGAAVEFPINLGEVRASRLYLKNAVAEVEWENGTRLQTFVHANEPVGWFLFENLPENVSPVILAPPYEHPVELTAEAHSYSSLARLGYQQGKIEEGPNEAHFHQQGWGDFSYDVSIRWQRNGKQLRGVWSVTSSLSNDQAEEETQAALQRGLQQDYQTHQAFWKDYWVQSDISLPDSLLQKQYDNEMYKFGSVAREYGYPISLQAIWTADNGMLPPWKGDFHHDLNTELSYWPAYTGNHLKEALGYLNTLWAQRDVYKNFTRQYFGTEGINVPGVATLTGEPMGGWIQYAMSPTVGAWLAHHFYLHWKYSVDTDFLRERAYPFLKEVATYLEQISVVRPDGKRVLPISSSPEIFNNSLQAWFTEMTNFDRAMMHAAFREAAEMADSLGLTDDAQHWRELDAQLPDFDLDADGALTFAPGFPYDESHRHFSHAVAFHPLGLLDVSQDEATRHTILATLDKIKREGPSGWCGYSYAWYANMLARVGNGEEAAEALRIFASCFCLPNTFHANGDQSGTGKSSFTYRPFTLEGNFAFAAGVQEMLLQSHTGIIRIFPAIPADWKDVSFERLRAQGGFIVSATQRDGHLKSVWITSEQGGKAHLDLSEHEIDRIEGAISTKVMPDGTLRLDTEKGKTVIISFK